MRGKATRMPVQLFKDIKMIHKFWVKILNNYSAYNAKQLNLYSDIETSPYLYAKIT